MNKLNLGRVKGDKGDKGDVGPQGPQGPQGPPGFAIISKAEAEAGDSTEPRTFTAQRVRQAIVAWFNGISGAIGRTILGRSTAAQVRDDIGLGTAATANLTTSATDGTAGRVLKVGDGGWMGRGLVGQVVPLGYPASVNDITNQTKVIRSDVQDNGVEGFATGIHFSVGRTWGRLRVRHTAPEAWIQGGIAHEGTGWTASLYHTGNTTIDPDGALKTSSPVINIYTDKHDLHNESQFGATPVVTRKSKGVYEITGTLGLRSEGWYLDTPSDRNGNKYFNIEWTQNVTPNAVAGVVSEYRDDIVVIIETFERVWNKNTGLFENGAPMDINDLQDRFVQLRFNEIKVDYDEQLDDSN